MKRRNWFVLGVMVSAFVWVYGGAFLNVRAAGPWYVAPGGNDANSCESPASPCATINGAVGKASSGDSVYVAKGTYTNSSGDEVVLISKSITLSGGWDATFSSQNEMSTIDGSGLRRGITTVASATVLVERFLIQNGKSGPIQYDYGGGISNSGTMTLTDSKVSGNLASGSSPSGAGIYNKFGTMTLNRSSVSDNTVPINGGCGGIFNDGIITLNDSTISGNTGGFGGGGGGICNNANVILNNSTVSGNTSLAGGGGIYNFGSLTLNSSTVSDNSSLAGGSGTGDGGGILNIYGTVTLQNSILANNSAAGNGPDCAGTMDSSGYNLIGDTFGCAFTPGIGDITNVNADLGTLIGKPGYHALFSGSPAVDAGNPAGCIDNLGNLLTTDQRGAARVGNCDIGSFEYTSPGPAASVIANSGTPQRTAPNLAFNYPLQAAVLDSLGSPVSNTEVTFTAPSSEASGTFGDTGTNMTTATSNASGVSAAALFTANSFRGTYTVTATVNGIATPARFLLSNVGWYVASSGSDNNNCQTPSTACATINGALSMSEFIAEDYIFVASGTYSNNAGSEVVLLNKSASLSGGWDNGFTTQSGMSTIDGEGSRRGVTVQIDSTSIIDRFIIQSGSAGNGGGVFNDGILTITNSNITGNTAGNSGGSGFGGGGGIFNGGILTLTFSTVSDNILLGNFSGGGIFNYGTANGGIMVIQDSFINNNGGQNSSEGGGIYNGTSWALMAIDNTTISNNHSISRGGGIKNSGVITITNSSISDNSAIDRGGGIHNESLGTIDINNTTIFGNDGGNLSGGINSFGTIALNNTSVTKNTADIIAGGIGNFGGTLYLQNSLLADNTVGGNGPDCYGGLSSLGYNLVGNTLDCDFSSTTGDLLNLEAGLWPEMFGSPGYQPLLFWSPAINAGNPAGCTDSFGNLLNTDQRGIGRVGRCDIGAYEYDPGYDPLSHIFLPITLR